MTEAAKEVTIQYFDGCPNWQTTEGHLRELRDGGIDFSLEFRRIASVEEADAVGFRGSPTILIDGKDPFADPKAPVGLACRVYRTPAGLAGTPTLEQLRTAILGA